jgi:N-methylhydantoinase A/oxoprolinase/acetone carboxylase beta subunit
VLEALADGPVAELDVAPNRLSAQAVTRLRRRGLVRVATFTPTDAARLLGQLDHGDLDAAALGAELLARQQDYRGRPVAGSGPELAELVQQRLVTRSVECVLAAALGHDNLDGPEVVAGPIVQAALARHRGLVALTVSLTGPIVAVGASAPTYYPRVAEALGTGVVLPTHGEVANAVGAVVGRIRVRCQTTVTQPRTGSFRVHAGHQPQFFQLDEARRWATQHLSRDVTNLARAAGADEPDVEMDWTARTALVNGREILVEGTLTATATGRPRLG